jgi:hypothetical protein
MKRRFGPAALLTVLMLAAAAFAADKKADKKKDPAPKDSSPADYKALADAHTVTGKLLSVGGSDKSLNLRVEYQILQPNAKGAKGQGHNNMQHLLREQQQIMRTRNPWVRAQKLQQFEIDVLRQQNRAAGQTFKTISEHKDFDLQSTADVTVRYQDPPAQYDDKGYLKKYTAAELKEMKGKDSNLPGYAADFDKLAPGQTVRVTLAKPKADKDKPKDKDAPDDVKPLVSMIVIVADAPPSDAPAKGKGKKNK